MPAAIITKCMPMVASASRWCGRQYSRMERSGFTLRPDAFLYSPRRGEAALPYGTHLGGGRSTEVVGQAIVPGRLVGRGEVRVGRARVRHHEQGCLPDPQVLGPQRDRRARVAEAVAAEGAE